MPSKTVVEQILYNNRTQTETLTNKTLTSPTTNSPTITSATIAGTITNSATQTLTGSTTVTRAGELVEADFDPENRVWVRSDFTSAIYTKAVISDWSLFKSVASANMDWVASGSATAFGCTANSNGANIISASNSSSFMFIKPRTGSRLNKVKWNTSNSPRFRALVKTGTITNARIVVGLYSTDRPKFLRNSAGDSNRIEVFMDKGADSRWRVMAAKGGASSSAALVAVASDTVYDIDIRVDSSRVPTVYVNGTLRYTGTALAASKKLIPIIGLQSEGAKRNMSVFHTLMSQAYS